MTTEYDYERQAWTVDGRYVRCGHPDSMGCQCYGRVHEGEPAAAGTFAFDEDPADDTPLRAGLRQILASPWVQR